jgi:thymidylate kinase
MLTIDSSRIENVLFALEEIVDESGKVSENERPTLYQKLQKKDWGIPKTLFQEFIKVTKILVRSSHPSLGRLVVVTGIDKSGKETQAFNVDNKPGILSLYDYLVGKSFKVLKVALPSYDTILGSLVASYLRKENSAITIVGNLGKDIAWVLWSLDRAQHNPKVERWLCKDTKNIVLAKRWTESNIAYQKALGVSEKRILQFERSIVRADYTLVLDVPSKSIFKRMEASGEMPDKYETPELLSKVSDAYKNLQHFYPYGRILHIDGSGSFEEVNKRLIGAIAKIESS